MFLILGQSPSLLTGLFHPKAPLLQKKSFAYFCASCSDEFWDRLVTFHRKQIFYKFWLEFHGRYRWLQTNNSFITWSFPSWVHLPFHILLLLLPLLCLPLSLLEWFLGKLWFLLKYHFLHVIFWLILIYRKVDFSTGLFSDNGFLADYHSWQSHCLQILSTTDI